MLIFSNLLSRLLVGSLDQLICIKSNYVDSTINNIKIITIYIYILLYYYLMIGGVVDCTLHCSTTTNDSSPRRKERHRGRDF